MFQYEKQIVYMYTKYTNAVTHLLFQGIAFLERSTLVRNMHMYLSVYVYM